MACTPHATYPHAYLPAKMTLQVEHQLQKHPQAQGAARTTRVTSDDYQVGYHSTRASPLTPWPLTLEGELGWERDL